MKATLFAHNVLNSVFFLHTRYARKHIEVDWISFCKIEIFGSQDAENFQKELNIIFTTNKIFLKSFNYDCLEFVNNLIMFISTFCLQLQSCNCRLLLQTFNKSSAVKKVSKN